MHEHDVEQLLRRYRPVGPPSELAARIVGDTSSRRIWPWAAAAAALLALTLGAKAASERLVGTMAMPPDPIVTAADDLIDRFGTDETSRRLVESMIAEQQIRAELTNDE